MLTFLITDFLLFFIAFNLLHIWTYYSVFSLFRRKLSIHNVQTNLFSPFPPLGNPHHSLASAQVKRLLWGHFPFPLGAFPPNPKAALPLGAAPRRQAPGRWPVWRPPRHLPKLLEGSPCQRGTDS